MLVMVILVEKGHLASHASGHLIIVVTFLKRFVGFGLKVIKDKVRVVC